jgi:hypothetical protein
VRAVNGVTQIDTGENGEDVGLQERDQQLKCSERNREAKRKDR